MTSDFLPNSAGELAGAETAVATDHSDFVLEPRASLPRTHVAAAIGAWLDKTDEERIARILSDIEIIHPTLEGLLNEADWLVLEPRRHRARGIVLTGPHGSGKSVYAKIVQARYPLHGPPADPDDRPAPKALLIQMSGARRTKAVLSRILEATKVPVSKSITISDRELLVVETLRRINCGVLILDEMQDILQAPEGEQVRVLEIIKFLMNTLSLPIIAIGPPSAGEAFRADPNLQARFEVLSIPAWEVGDDFALFLATLEQYLPLRKPSGLAGTEMQKALIKHTGGNLDGILTRVRMAAVNAVVNGTERITVRALEAPIARPSIEKLKGSR
ncbi:MAG TPA: TniB family NTP-binding protein [Burkholderiales bacterium]|nr:TniB family NTP-binding protein [Burkholderiales bacterium]